MRARWTVVLVIMVAVMSVGLPRASAVADGPISWGVPQLIDHTPPYTAPTNLYDTACLSAVTCLTVGNGGTIVTTGPSGAHTTTGVDGGANLDGITCPSQELCLVSVGNASQVLVSTDPGAATAHWSVTALTTGQRSLDGVTCASASLCVAWAEANRIWVTSAPTRGAATWRAVALSSDRRETVESVACAPRSTFCEASLGALEGTDQSRFATTTDPTGGANAWQVTAASPAYAVNSLACPTSSLCVGLGVRDIETSTDPSAGARSWHSGNVLSPDGFDTLEGLTCPSATQCVATTQDGAVVTSPDPAGGAPSYTASQPIDEDGFDALEIACPTATTCVSADSVPGVATITLGTTPNETVASNLAGSTAIQDIACPTSALCLTVDGNGTILHSAHPAASASTWAAVASPVTAQGGLTAVSCPTDRFCIAVGYADTVETTSTPGATATWKYTHLPFRYYDNASGETDDDLTAVSCPSVHLCVAGNDAAGVMVTTQPAGGASRWRLRQVGAARGDLFDAVSCPDRSLCVAGDAQFGQIAVSTHPARAARDWTSSQISPGGDPAGITSLSCPTARFCLAADTAGAVDVSTNPTGGRRAWTHVRHVAPTAIVGVACRSARLCVAVDKRNDVYASTDPTGPRSAWHATRLGTARLTAVTCAPSLCLAASTGGSVFAGRTRTAS